MVSNLGSERIDEAFEPEIATRELAKKHKPYRLEENYRKIEEIVTIVKNAFKKIEI